MYKCAICSKEFENPLDRAKCEIACTDKASNRKEELENKINEKYVEVVELIREYTEEFEPSLSPWVDLMNLMV